MGKKIGPVKPDDSGLPPEEFLKTIPRLILPPHKPPSRDDLKKRRAIARRMDRFRETMGPIRGTVTNLIREDRASR